MYDNIGGKIKGLAKAIFIIETIASVITGFIILTNSYYLEMILISLLVMIVGPIVAWISSWLLYGFGELIDKACDIADNSRGCERKLETLEKAKKANQGTAQNEKVTPQKTPQQNVEVYKEEPPSASDYKSTIDIVKKNKSNIPYWCAKCGHDGPYKGNCPECNSSMKVYNVQK